ncbi:hypothetical protein BD560DRAFT_441812 [Blakeslea trispora]|nr:hypothetical protein BD560DRAFT_441812 [Blakeslea trispora]
MSDLNRLTEELFGDDEDNFQVEEHVSPEPEQLPPLRRPTSDMTEPTVQTTFDTGLADLTPRQQRIIQAEMNWQQERDERIARQRAIEQQAVLAEMMERRRRGEDMLSRLRMPAYRQLENALRESPSINNRILPEIFRRINATRRVRPRVVAPATPVQIVAPPVPGPTSRPVHIEEEPAVVDNRPVDSTINLEGFNALCAQINNPEEQVRLAFEGTFMGAHYPVVQNAVVPLREMTFTVDVDAFSILSYEIPLPEGQPLSMYILANLILSISKNKQIYYEGQSIHTCQNIHLANFGYTGRFKTNIFFPRLGGFSHVMHADVQDLFVDQVLLPALMQTVQPEYSTNIPTSLQVEKYRATRRAGRYTFEPFYFYHRDNQTTLASAMREIIDQNPNLNGFQDFFFLTYTFGNKYRLDLNNYDQQLRHHFNDLDFNLFDLENTFIDIGLQFSSPASTGIWILDEQASPVLPLFFTILNRSSRYLRLDPFANNANLGGCSYTTHRVEGNGNYHLMKFQCYQLIKSLFYLRTESGYRHNAFDLEPQDFVQNSAKVLRNYQALVNALQQSRTRTFPARAEFTLRYEDGIRLLENAQQEAMRILSNQPPVMTVLSTEVVIDYLINMVNGYTAFYQSISNQVDLIHQPESLSSLAVLAYIYSGLLSRPYDWSTWRYVSRYLNRVRSNRSQMLQLISLTINFDRRTRRWLLRDTLPMESLRAIFLRSLSFINSRERNARAGPQRRLSRSPSPVGRLNRAILRKSVIGKPQEVEVVNEDEVPTLPFELIQDPFNPLESEQYIVDPANQSLRLDYAPMLYETSRHPFRTYINMFQVHGRDIRVVDALIEGLMWHLFNNVEAPVTNVYLSQGRQSTDVEINVFQNQDAFYRFFNVNIIRVNYFFDLILLL